jgi:transposase
LSRIPTHALITDNQWKHLRRWIPSPPSRGRPITRSRRVLLDGIAWRVRVGAPWRFLPESAFGPWQTVYWLFRTWQLEGIWPMLLKTIRTFLDAAGRLTWDISIDSTVVRAHQHAAGAAARPVPDEPDDHAIGKSRGGRTTKVHAATDNAQTGLAMILTAGQAADSPRLRPLLDRVRVPRPGPGRPRTRPRRVMADKAYTSKANRAHLRKRGIQAVIPEKKDQRRNRQAKGRAGGRPPAFDTEAYKDRNTVERFFNRLKRFRAVATRYDKLAVRYEATVQVAMILDWKP